jgi:hypothetical protein
MEEVTMRTWLFTCCLVLSVALAFDVAFAAAPAAAPGQNKLLCFDGTSDGYGGTCTLLSKGARGPALLDTSSGGYAGVYVEASTMYGSTLSSVKQLAYAYEGTAPGAGAPRMSVPVDTTGDGTTDMWLYIASYYCNDGAGTTDAIHDETCTIWTSTSESYANWAALVAAYPTATVATDNYVFVVADEPGTWTISGVKFGTPK